MNIPVLLENPSKFSARPGHAGGGAYAMSLQHTQDMFSPKWKCRVEEEGALFPLLCFSRVDRRDLPHPRQKLPRSSGRRRI
jgi:hypothetical protein